jgi:signal peptidase II
VTAGAPTTGRPHWAIFVGIALTVFALDQLTKAWLVGILAEGEQMPVIGDLLRLVHHRNTGALFGLFEDSAALFAVFSIGVVLVILAFHARSGRSMGLSIALGLLLGGALGNMTDRIRLGSVVDFVDAGIGSLRFWTFNVADASISLALVLLIAMAVLPGLTRRPPAPAAPGPESPGRDLDAEPGGSAGEPAG